MLNTEATEDPAPIGLTKRMKGAGDNGNAKQQVCGMVCILVSGVAFIFLIMIFSSFNRLTETEQMLVELLDYSIDFGQGYLFGEPRLSKEPPEEFQDPEEAAAANF